MLRAAVIVGVRPAGRVAPIRAELGSFWSAPERAPGSPACGMVRGHLWLAMRVHVLVASR